MRQIVLLLAVLLAAACETSRGAGEAAPAQGSYRIGTRAIPLPPGAWHEIGRADEQVQSNVGTLVFRTVLLAQEDKGRLAGLIVVSANLPAGVQLGFTGAANSFACRQDGSDLVPVRREILERSFDCRRVLRWSPAGDGRGANGTQPAWRDFAARRDRDPAWAPLLGHVVSFGLADRDGQITAAYGFNPETRGLLRDARPWPQNGWNPANQSPAQRQYLARVLAWSEATGPLVRGGFASGSAVEAPAL